MAYSQNEIESLARRAARGTGLPWGIAEEAGKAARWLSSRNLPGPETLADILKLIDGTNYLDLMPVINEGAWRARSDLICPLIAGVVLGDCSGSLASGGEIKLERTANPLFLAPFAARAVESAGSNLELRWDRVVMTFGPADCAINADENALTAEWAEQVTCRTVDRAAIDSQPLSSNRSVDAQSWGVLAAFAHRIIVPATEESRLSGAGAGLSDND